MKYGRYVLALILLISTGFAVWKMKHPTRKAQRDIKFQIKMNVEPESQKQFVSLIKTHVLRLNNTTADAEVQKIMGDLNRSLCERFAKAELTDWVGEILYEEKGKPEERILVKLSPHIYLKSTQTLKQFSTIKENNWVKVSGQIAQECPVVEVASKLDTAVLVDMKSVN